MLASLLKERLLIADRTKKSYQKALADLDQVKRVMNRVSLLDHTEDKENV